MASCDSNGNPSLFKYHFE
jgi:protein transport protein SEC13